MQKRPFTELGLSPETLKAVAHIGYELASPIQGEAIPVLLTGRDVVGQSQTGSGKTAAFALPAIERVDTTLRAPQVLVLCPTRELAMQVAEEVSRLAQFKRGVRELPIYGGASYERQFAGLKNGAQIIIGTPGRVMDHIERKSLSMEKIGMVVLDEADRMLDMGFRDDMVSILSKAKPDRQTVLFSATLPPAIKQMIAKFTKDPVNIRIEDQKLTVPDIDQVYYEVNRRSKLEALCRIIDLLDLHYGIIFCATKLMVDELTEHLAARGFMADKLHGDIAQSARERVMRKLREKKIEFLVATDVAARGLDVDDLEVVINYDLPHDAEDYVHRIGRTGRAGRSGRAITFADGREVWKLQHIMRFTKARIRRETVPTAEQVEQRRSSALFDKVRTTIESGAYKKHDALIDQLLDAGHTPTDIASALFSMLEGDGPKPVEIPEDRPAPPKRGHEQPGRGNYPAYEPRTGGKKFERRDKFEGGDRPQGGKLERFAPRDQREQRAPIGDRGTRPVFGSRDEVSAQSHEPGMVRLSMNSGADQMVRPADVVGFILNESALPREALGAIHILPAVTLFDVREEAARDLVGTLRGKRFKGRKLIVDLAANS
ncbi:MAG: DEAD/DEAH box helicase [Chthoniobacteraceae bacterium]